MMNYLDLQLKKIIQLHFDSHLKVLTTISLFINHTLFESPPFTLRLQPRHVADCMHQG